METDLTVIYVEVALNQRQNSRFPRAGRPADAQHLPRFQRDVNLLKGRLVGLRVAKAVYRQRERTAPFRHRLDAIVNHRRFRQQSANAAIGCAAALDDVEHPRQRQHRPNHQPKVHHKTGQLAERQIALHHHPATAGNRQQVRHADSNINRRVKARVDTRDAHVFHPGVRRVGGKLRRLPVFKAEGFDHANAGQAFLGAIVKAGERRLRHFEALVQQIAVTMDNQRHNRHRHQR